MTRARLLLVHCVMLGLLLGSGFDIVVGREHWPFSHYPMYSRIELDTTITKLHLYGVPRAADMAELPMLDDAYIQPFDKTRLTSALQGMARAPDSEARLREAMRDVFTRYEAARVAGQHSGPALQSIRAYWVTWQLDPRARNRDQPDQRELVLEWRP